MQIVEQFLIMPETWLVLATLTGLAIGGAIAIATASLYGRRWSWPDLPALKAIDLRDLLLLLGGALLGAGVYTNWGIGWAMILLALLLLVPIAITSWRP